MSETQQPSEPHVCETTAQPLDAPLRPWTLPAQHRRPAVVWLIVSLIVLQLIFAGLVAIQSWKFIDLGERIEQLENLTKPLKK